MYEIKDDIEAMQFIKSLLRYIGEDPTREGIQRTPERIVRASKELFAGYSRSPAEVLKPLFTCAYDEMVVLRGIEFYSTCEHHLMPFFGSASIAYIPNGRVVGISKLARLLEVYARRLQIQEQLTAQIADAIEKHLEPRGTAVFIQAQHLCMTARGVGKQNSIMVTSTLRGCFKDGAPRAEFLALARA